MEYNFRDIEKKWHDDWVAKQVYKVEMDPSKPIGTSSIKKY